MTGASGYRVRLKEGLPLAMFAGKQLAVQIQWLGSAHEVRFAVGGDDALTALSPGWRPVIEDGELVALDRIPAGAR